MPFLDPDFSSHPPHRNPHPEARTTGEASHIRSRVDLQHLNVWAGGQERWAYVCEEVQESTNGTSPSRVLRSEIQAEVVLIRHSERIHNRRKVDATLLEVHVLPGHTSITEEAGKLLRSLIEGLPGANHRFHGYTLHMPSSNDARHGPARLKLLGDPGAAWRPLDNASFSVSQRQVQLRVGQGGTETVVAAPELRPVRDVADLPADMPPLQALGLEEPVLQRRQAPGQRPH